MGIIKNFMNKVKSRRMANFAKSPHRSTSKKISDKERQAIYAQWHRDFYQEEIHNVSGFGLVHTPTRLDEETEQYLEQLRKLGQ